MLSTFQTLYVLSIFNSDTGTGNYEFECSSNFQSENPFNRLPKKMMSNRLPKFCLSNWFCKFNSCAFDRLFLVFALNFWGFCKGFSWILCPSFKYEAWLDVWMKIKLRFNILYDKKTNKQLNQSNKIEQENVESRMETEYLLSKLILFFIHFFCM